MRLYEWIRKLGNLVLSVDQWLLLRCVALCDVVRWGEMRGGGAMMGRGRRGRGSPVISQCVCERTGTTCASLNVSNCGDLAKSRPSHAGRAAAPPTPKYPQLFPLWSMRMNYSYEYSLQHPSVLPSSSSSGREPKTFLNQDRVGADFTLHGHL